MASVGQLQAPLQQAASKALFWQKRRWPTFWQARRERTARPMKRLFRLLLDFCGVSRPTFPCRKRLPDVT